MRNLIRAAVVLAICAPLGLMGLSATAAPGDDTADAVVGQTNFVDGGCLSGTSAYTLCGPAGMAVDASGSLYVADQNLNRVLQYDNPLATGNYVADRVFGQPDFVSTACNNGGISASSLCSPRSLDVDSAGNLWVSDGANSRVVVYLNPTGSDAVADFVIGQPDFLTAACGMSSTQVCNINGIDVDSSGNLLLVDSLASRVLLFINPLTTGGVADIVLGQPDVATGTFCSTPVSASNLCAPLDVLRAPSGRVFVSDPFRNRVLVWDTLDVDADHVLGQPDFSGETCNAGGLGSASLCTPWGLGLEGESLYVADRLNERVLRFDAISTSAPASAVYGQGGSFTTNACLPTSDETLCRPVMPEVDAAGNLWTSQGDDGEATRVTLHLSCANALDTECDGRRNPQQPAHLAVNPFTSSDNCPTIVNANQINSDGNFVDNSPPYASSVDDRTWPNSDYAGDACDADVDNDDILDATESGGPPCASATNPTNPFLRDTDGDRFLDGAECALGTNPVNIASKPLVTACGATTDADGDKIADRTEFCFYGTLTNNTDSDGDRTLDGATDGCEIASINGDRVVSSGDQGMLAAGISGAQPYTVNVDINKDGNLNSGDQGLMASFISPPGQCPG